MNQIEWLKEIPARNGDRVFLIDSRTGETLTFGALHENARKIAADLRRRGLRVGDRAAILLQNSTSFAQLYFGCLYAGVVVVPVNPVNTTGEIDYILASSGSRALFTSPETAGRADLRRAADSGVAVLMLPGVESAELRAGASGWSVAGLPDAAGFEPFDGVTERDTMCIVYTSGTTSKPKGVVHRIGSMIGNGRAFGKRLGVGQANRFFNVLAMSYLGGYYNLLMLPYCNESSVVLANTFDARSAIDFWSAAIQHEVNTLWLVPTIMAILMEMDRGTDGEQFCREKVRLGLVGTAPLAVKLKRDFERRYGIAMYENYGLSETFFITTNAPTVPDLDGCVGRPMPGVQVTVLGADGKALPYGHEGELNVLTPYLMEGYVDAETHQADALLPDDLFPTGDVGVLTETGDLFITGRSKDLIIRGGVNISPASIENVLHTHEAVLECAVVGVPHSLYGETVAAAVRVGANSDFAAVSSDLKRLCAGQLSADKQPAYIIQIEEIPRTSTGKIRKEQVRELLARKLGLDTAAREAKPMAAAQPSTPPMLPGRIKRSITRTPGEVVDQLRGFPVSIVTDCLNRLGVMDSRIHALAPGRPFCGPAVTVEEVEGGNLMSHAALELLTPGDVLCIDGKGVTTRSAWGGLQSLMAQQRGAVGVVVNGCVRDAEEVAKGTLPVYALGYSPGGPLKGWGGNINLPIACGGVVVCPGDVVMGDDDGVVVVPREVAAKLPALCERRKAMEEVWFEKVAGGVPTLDAVNLRGLLEKYGITTE